MIATSSFLTTLKCTKFVFGRGSAPDPTQGAYSATPDSLAGLRGPTSKGERRERERKIERGEGRGREWDGTGRTRPLTQIPGSATGKFCCTFFSDGTSLS